MRRLWPQLMCTVMLNACTVSARPARALARNLGLSDDLFVLSWVGCNAQCK